MMRGRPLARAVTVGVTAVVCAGLVAAQEPTRWTERSFLPLDYNVEVVVDLAKVHDAGIYDHVERSPLRLMLEEFRREFGFDFAEIDRIHWGVRQTYAEDDLSSAAVMTMSGSDRVSLDGAKPGALGAGFESMTVEDVVLHRNGEGEAWCSPRAGLIARSTGHQLLPVLRGERHAGVPIPDLLSLANASTEGFVRMAGVLPSLELQRRHRLLPLPDAWFVEQDAPVAIRLRAFERAVDGESSRVAVEWALRFANGTAGPVRLRDAIVAWSEAPGADVPAVIAELVGGAEFVRDGRDLTVTLDLGTSRQAVGLAASAVGMLVPMAFTNARAVPAPVAVPAQGLDVAAPPKKAARDELRKGNRKDES